MSITSTPVDSSERVKMNVNIIKELQHKPRFCAKQHLLKFENCVGDSSMKGYFQLVVTIIIFVKIPLRNKLKKTAHCDKSINHLLLTCYIKYSNKYNNDNIHIMQIIHPKT